MSAGHTGAGAMWGGRFESAPDPLFRALNDSLPFDYRLARHDIEGSRAWATALGGAGVLTKVEVDTLVSALRDLDARVMADPRSPLASDAEDVHSWVEMELVARLGTLGKKLHTGRSRNDQVATDLRLFVRAAIDERRAEVLEAQRSLIRLAKRASDVVMPGYTHLQRAQPVMLAHWCLAYVEMLDRDQSRMIDAQARMNVCPLGSGALAGTAYAIDREALARDLGFARASANSLDGVSDRDFVLESLAANAMCASHLSRLGEDLVIYSTQEFGLFEQADGVSSGSSLMPQKKNPDASELLRAKAGRITGALVTLLTVTKGLPLAYNKDLQEDKEPIFDSMDSLSLALRVVPRIIDGLKPRAVAARRAAEGGYANATDLADYLVTKGIPFRESHELAGRIVRLAIEHQKAIEHLDLALLQSVVPCIADDVFDAIKLESGFAKREVLGGTGPQTVARAVALAASRFGIM